MLYRPTPTLMPNMDIVHYLYLRGNVIWVIKLRIGSIWETGFYIEPRCHPYRMRMVSYIELLVPTLNHWFNVRVNHGLETID